MPTPAATKCGLVSRSRVAWNLYRPAPGPGAVHGGHSGRTLPRSRYTEWLGQHPAFQRTALTAAAALPFAARASRRARRRLLVFRLGKAR